MPLIVGWMFYYRCINGSTLLHTAAYFGLIPVVKSLLSHRVDVNLQDYKGATPLHRVRSHECMMVSIELGYPLSLSPFTYMGNECVAPSKTHLYTLCVVPYWIGQFCAAWFILWTWDWNFDSF